MCSRTPGNEPTAYRCLELPFPGWHPLDSLAQSKVVNLFARRVGKKEERPCSLWGLLSDLYPRIEETRGLL